MHKTIADGVCILCSQNIEKLHEQGAIKLRLNIPLFQVIVMFELKLSEYWCIMLRLTL